jgi:uncharacterized membrane protein required for colicin V production
MASLIVVLIILACAAYQYLQGTLVKSFATVITAICAGVVAFGYFEPLANVLIEREMFAPWAQTISLALLFVLAFIVLQIIVSQLARRPVDLGFWPERVGRVVCGILAGLIISGVVLTALATAPLPNSKPYQRFDATSPDAENPGKALLNADGLATGWFGIISRGSFSGKRSFGVLHPDFLDQVFLNRHEIEDGITIYTDSDAIELPGKEAAWPAPEGLRDSSGKPVLPKSGHNLTIVRVGIKRSAVKDAGTFTPSQLRLVCKRKDQSRDALAGKGKNVYPIGYLKTANQLQTKRLNDQIKIESGDFDDNVKWIDFAFYVPNDYVGVLVEFKQNNIAQLPLPVTAAQAPLPVPFIPLAQCATDTAELQPVGSARVYGTELAAGSNFLAGLTTIEINGPNEWQEAQTARSIKPALFEDGQFSYTRAELEIEKPVQEEPEEEPNTPRPAPTQSQAGRTFRPRRIRRQEVTAAAETVRESRGRGIPSMLKPLKGYNLLSLKCNRPSVGAAIKGGQLPVLVEVSGLTHHAVGVIASGKVGNQYVCEFDYCSSAAEGEKGCLVIAEDGSVTKPFPDTVWLTEQAEEIFEFYVLYLVKSGRNTIITSVRPGDSQTTAGFKGYEGFLTK